MAGERGLGSREDWLGEAGGPVAEPAQLRGRLERRSATCSSFRELQRQGACRAWWRLRARVSARSGTSLRRRRGVVAARESTRAALVTGELAEALVYGARRGRGVGESSDRLGGNDAAGAGVGQERRRRLLGDDEGLRRRR